jgi:hypothetical protein
MRILAYLYSLSYDAKETYLFGGYAGNNPTNRNNSFYILFAVKKWSEP